MEKATENRYTAAHEKRIRDTEKKINFFLTNLYEKDRYGNIGNTKQIENNNPHSWIELKNYPISLDLMRYITKEIYLLGLSGYIGEDKTLTIY